jgi:hypothetical protein
MRRSLRRSRNRHPRAQQSARSSCPRTASANRTRGPPRCGRGAFGRDRLPPCASACNRPLPTDTGSKRQLPLRRSHVVADWRTVSERPARPTPTPTRGEKPASQRFYSLAMGFAWLLLVAAAVGAFVAWAGYTGLCQDGTHLSCRNGNPSWELVAQLVIAFVGLVAAGMMVYFAQRRLWRRSLSFLGVSVFLYGAWAILLDAATHGWDRWT